MNYSQSVAAGEVTPQGITPESGLELAIKTDAAQVTFVSDDRKRFEAHKIIKI